MCLLVLYLASNQGAVTQANGSRDSVAVLRLWIPDYCKSPGNSHWRILAWKSWQCRTAWSRKKKDRDSCHL